MSAAGELTDVRPVILERSVPLALVDALQIGQPAAAGEMRRHVAGEAAGQPASATMRSDPELAGEPDAVAQRGVMSTRRCFDPDGVDCPSTLSAAISRPRASISLFHSRRASGSASSRGMSQWLAGA